MARADNIMRRLQGPRSRWALVGVALLLLVVVFGVMRSRTLKHLSLSQQTRRVLTNIRREPAGPELRALLAPLTEGSVIGAWRLNMIEGLRDGWIHVLFVRGTDVIEVIVARAQGGSVRPPVTAGPYALHNFSRSDFDDDAVTIMRAIAERLRGHGDLPVPAGLRPFTPNGGR